MSWVSRTGSWLASFLTWRRRINRAQFAIAYFGSAFFGALLGNMLIALAMSFGGMTFEQIFNDMPRAALPAFLVLSYLLLCMLVARAHDVGWPAPVPVLIFMLPWPTWFVLADHMMDVAGGALVRLFPNPPMTTLLIVMFTGVMIYSVMLLALFIMPGQNGDNRYGPSPSGDA